MKMRVMLAANVEHWRIKYNMGKLGLAMLSNLTERQVHRIIKCKTGASVDDIGRLARGLKVKPSTLLKDVPKGDE